MDDVKKIVILVEEQNLRLVTISPVVQLHLCCLPLFKLTSDISRSTQDVFHVEEELLSKEKGIKRADHKTDLGFQHLDL